ncbi:MAG: hypothetical protein LW850_16485 [Planctomycetaceae bacterium]|jgi:hypothetical protein|nr:hypothetical protein [Planctomycetaceae bacterium]MCE2811983.1 hypothetical protein [Planctomycetaceae bacterium]
MAFGQMATDRFPKPGAMPQAMVNIAFGESKPNSQLSIEQTRSHIWPTAKLNVARGIAPGRPGLIAIEYGLWPNGDRPVPQTWGDAPGYDEYRRWRIKTE